jgi:lipopolysaccharide/colanic/teichoic acid biosynthesis glycosyltransferase
VTNRAFDVVTASTGLLLLAPVLAVIAALIKLDDGGPVLFAQTRVGRFGRPFRMLKFRTMVTDAGQRGGLLTVRGDPRITRSGRVLRATKLDELPQLVNVLIGHMSLVGPRPELEKYVALYDAAQRQVLELQPGITDPASIAYRDENALLARAPDPEEFYIREVMPDKIRINLEYAERATPLTDVAIVGKTLALLLDPRQLRSGLARRGAAVRGSIPVGCAGRPKAERHDD